MADVTSDIVLPSNVIVMTQFSRLKNPAPSHAPPSGCEFELEALTALAEALAILGNTFAAYPTVTPPDPMRLKRLSERASALNRELPAYFAARCGGFP